MATGVGAGVKDGNGVGLGGGGSIWRLSTAIPVPPEFVALRLTLKPPETEGVPVTAPVPVLMKRPEGRPVALKLVAKLVAKIW